MQKTINQWENDRLRELRPSNCWAALHFMKMRYTFALCLIFGAVPFVGRAQVSSSSSPFFLAVSNISSGYVHVWTNSTVSFSFTDSAVVKVDELESELNKNGFENKRRVKITDGDQIIAEGRLIGTVRAVNSLHTDGFILRFDSPEMAIEVADIIRERGALRYPHYVHAISSQ
jgi:hypothetical protein